MNFSLYALRRALYHWQTLLTLILGVIFATGVLASGPLLINTVMEFALPHKLRSVSPLDSNFRLSTYDALSLESYNALDASVHSQVDDQIGIFTKQVISTAGSAWAHPWQMEQLQTDQRVNLRFYDEIEEHVEFVDGGWPKGEIFRQNEIKVVIGEAFADLYGMKVGDRLPLSISGQEKQPSFWFLITGIVRPISYRDIYWFGEFSPLRDQGDQRWATQFSAITHREALFQIHEALFPKSRTELNWNVILDPSTIQVKDVPILLDQIRELRTSFDEFDQQINVATHIEEVLTEFRSQSQIVRVTLYVLVGEVVLLTLYYIVMIATLSAQQVEGEFTTLSSRGASFSQIFFIQTIEAGSIGILALISGPAVAIFLVWGLSKFGPIADVSQTDWTLHIPTTSWLVTGVGAAACMMGLLIPARFAMKRSIVAYARDLGRVNRPPIWQRLYLDVFALIIGLAFLWRLQLYGGITSGSGIKVDWLLLFSPLMLLVGSATIMLRVFPWILRFIERVFAKARGLPAVLALWQTSRNPTHIARLVLLLTLAMALGILSTGLNASLDQSEYERARYITGGDLRLYFDHYIPKPESDNLTTIRHAAASTAVWRGTGSVSIRSYRTYPKFEVIAIEPYEFAKVASFRSDFSELPMGQLLGQIVTGPDQIPDILTPLPGQPSQVGFWVLEKPGLMDQWETNAVDYLYMKVKLQTAKGEYFTTNLNLTPLSIEQPSEGSLPDDPNATLTWRYFEASLPAFSPEMYPLSLHSFWFSILPMGDQTRYRLALILDDFSVQDRQTNERIVFEDFESVEHIWTLNDSNYSVRYSKRQDTHSGSGSILLDMPGSPNPKGLALFLAGKLTVDPLPALVSEEFIKMTQVKLGDIVIGNINGIQNLIEIRGIVRNFPTLYDESGNGFLITARAPLMASLNREIRSPVNVDEVWVKTRTDQEATDIINQYPEIVQARQLNDERKAIKAEPLLLGLRSVTYLSYLLTAILSLVGFATYFYLSARKREVAYGVLRSLGLSPVQLYGSLLLEQAVMIISGLTLGTLLGLLLNNLVLPGLPVTSGGNPPIPSFLVYEDWYAVIRLYAFLMGSFLAVLGGVTTLLWRSKLHSILRIGQE